MLCVVFDRKLDNVMVIIVIGISFAIHTYLIVLGFRCDIAIINGLISKLPPSARTI